MTKYFKDHDRFMVAPASGADIYDHLPPGQYLVRHAPLMGFYLQQVEPFKIPDRIFGDTLKRVDRVLNTYADRPGNTGVLASGKKGSGKTLFARALSIEAARDGIPTLVVGNSFEDTVGFNKFVTDITGKCVVLMDEFEKHYGKTEEQEKVLTLLDGTYTGNKLFVMTVNHAWQVTEFMRNRPGRVYYHFQYDVLETKFIEEYGMEMLKDPEHLPQLLKASDVVGGFSFDTLQALVEECNRYGESPRDILSFMNVSMDSQDERFDVVIMKDGEVVDRTDGRYNLLQRFSVRFNDGYLELLPHHCVRFDAPKRQYVYEKEGYEVRLSRSQLPVRPYLDV